MHEKYAIAKKGWSGESSSIGGGFCPAFFFGTAHHDSSKTMDRSKAMRALRDLGFTSNFLVMQSMLNKADRGKGKQRIYKDSPRKMNGNASQILQESW